MGHCAPIQHRRFVHDETTSFDMLPQVAVRMNLATASGKEWREDLVILDVASTQEMRRGWVSFPSFNR